MPSFDPVDDQTSRPRSMRSSGAFYVATFWTIAHMLSVVSTTIAVLLFLSHHKEPRSSFYLNYIVVGVLLATITLLISFFKRRNACCPLCRGTPLLNSRAVKHKKSFCLKPFNSGHTAILSIFFTQKFSCMYCGAKYDLLKKSEKRSRDN
jgi:hypothetical protein